MHLREKGHGTARPLNRGRHLLTVSKRNRPLPDGTETSSHVEATPQQRLTTAVHTTFDSFSVRGFRWFFVAMLGEMASINMQQVVRGYLVYLFTGSYAALGTVALVYAVPGMVLSLYGGVVADHARQKKHVVQVGQAANTAIAFTAGMLLLMHRLNYSDLLIIAFVQGVVQAMMAPARQSMIPEVVGMRRLMNAVALNAAGQNTMRILGPAAGGLLLAIFTPQWVYFFMTAAYFAAVAFLFKVPDTTPEASATGALQSGRRAGVRDMIAGIQYIGREPVLRMVLLINMAVILLSMPYVFLLPGFVAGVLHRGPATLGMLLSVTGAGALVGALVVASLPPLHRGLLYLLSSLVQGAMLALFAFSPWLWLTIPAMVLMGIGQAGRQSFSNVLVQHYTSDEYRGRVMSIYVLQFNLTRIGTFLVGVLAAVLGARIALGGTAVLMVVAVLMLLAFMPTFRRLE